MEKKHFAQKRQVQESDNAMKDLFDQEMNEMDELDELDTDLDGLEDDETDELFDPDEEDDNDDDEDDESEENDDDIADNDVGDDDESYDETEEDDEDLLTVKKSLRKPKLDEDDYIAEVGPPKAEKMTTGQYGPWIKITIPFKIKHPVTKEVVTVEFSANRSIDPKSRLYPVVKGILGTEPANGLDLRGLAGRKVKVSIEHRKDQEGNVWENIVSVRKFVPKR
ncbi:hypothetical protein H7K32_25510 [Brevibacillus agri]|uniref:hypothetical protein n=1 Tax=Brevibacillus agri TaxID=51101 RepID=UPI001C8CFBE8|nr:hypothetical protein [Brevibacillus agri]MBY0054922.1 hypothetical protein [Brevibacillus agri]